MNTTVKSVATWFSVKEFWRHNFFRPDLNFPVQLFVPNEDGTQAREIQCRMADIENYPTATFFRVIAEPKLKKALGEMSLEVFSS
jgi:hypothetical protein